MADNTRIQITAGDLQSPEVESYIETQAFLRRDVGPVADQPWMIRVIYANWFYLSICGVVGGFLGWAVTEPVVDDNAVDEFQNIFMYWLLFPIVTAAIALFVGAAEGIMCRNGTRTVKCGAIGLGVGFVGGLVAVIPTELLFQVMGSFAIAIQGNPNPQLGFQLSGVALLLFMMGRGVAWSLAAIPAGIGQGIALREKKVVINGLVGAVLGGLVGGLLFDPIERFFQADDGQAALSRAVGFSTIGGLVGLFIGLVEGWTKTAWLIMKKGPLAGKQFILFKDTTLLGSVPKADIYLFKDDAIEPKHAVILNRGGRFEIEDNGTADGTYVNGIPVTRHVLEPGDQIVMGKTVLEFSVRESDSAS